MTRRRATLKRVFLVRLLIATTIAGLASACSSSTGFSNGVPGGPSSTTADCTSPADLCQVLSLEQLNSACKASFSVPLRETEPFGGDGTDQGGFVGRQCRYYNDPANAAEPWVTLKRYCYGGGTAEAERTFDSDRESTKDTTTRFTENVAGIGEDAFYTLDTESETERMDLSTRQGNVLFGAELNNALGGTRETMKACLAAVVKATLAGAPAK